MDKRGCVKTGSSMRVRMGVGRRTGGGLAGLSTTGLAGVAAAGIPVEQAQGEVADEQEDLARQGHGDLHVGEEVAHTGLVWISIGHRFPSF